MDELARSNRTGIRRADSASVTLIAALLVLAIAPAVAATASPAGVAMPSTVAQAHAVRGPVCSAPVRALPGHRAPREESARGAAPVPCGSVVAGWVPVCAASVSVVAARPPPPA
ncbi:MAG: hypothetical protein AAGI30_07600 [Planctomycetota bacterium]